MGLIIKPGGHIERKKWEDGGYVVQDVTDSGPLHLMEPCVLEDGVTLRDIFVILKRDIDLYSIIINNWVEEIVEEGLSGKAPAKDDTSVDFLELYWEIEAEVGKDPEFGGHLFPSFHGWGTWPEDGHTPAGHKGGIAVDFSPSYELIDLPVKLRDAVGFSVEKNYRSKPGDRQEYPGATYSLFHILYAIIWELSFAGGPDDRAAKLEKLMESVRRIERGEEKTTPWEEIKTDLQAGSPELGDVFADDE